MVERFFIRIVVATALCAALSACVLAPVPAELPSPAFEQAGLYRLEVALAVFYGALLLVTPAFSGLARGRLPIEISTRGAKFAEKSDQSAEIAKGEIEKLEQTTKALGHGLADANLEIKRLNEISERDSTRPGIDSNDD
ncbi:MAG: hypothetical protein ACTHN3_07990 [Solirubrobacterales bacterium]